MEEWIENKLDEKEKEWDAPIGERLLKMVIVGTVSVLATAVASTTYDHFAKKSKELPAPTEQEPTES